jgi:hypothetical protein
MISTAASRGAPFFHRSVIPLFCVAPKAGPVRRTAAPITPTLVELVRAHTLASKCIAAKFLPLLERWHSSGPPTASVVSGHRAKDRDPSAVEPLTHGSYVNGSIIKGSTLPLVKPKIGCRRVRRVSYTILQTGNVCILRKDPCPSARSAPSFFPWRTVEPFVVSRGGDRHGRGNEQGSCPTPPNWLLAEETMSRALALACKRLFSPLSPASDPPYVIGRRRTRRPCWSPRNASSAGEEIPDLCGGYASESDSFARASVSDASFASVQFSARTKILDYGQRVGALALYTTVYCAS